MGVGNDFAEAFRNALIACGAEVEEDIVLPTNAKPASPERYWQMRSTLIGGITAAALKNRPASPHGSPPL